MRRVLVLLESQYKNVILTNDLNLTYIWYKMDKLRIRVLAHVYHPLTLIDYIKKKTVDSNYNLKKK